MLTEMEENKHFQYFYLKGKSKAQVPNIYAVYGEGTLNNQTYQKLFAKFGTGDFLMDDTIMITFFELWFSHTKTFF